MRGKYYSSLAKNIILILIFILLLFQTGFTKNMASDTYHYEFASYILESLYASETECGEEIYLDPEIEWLCAKLIYDEKALKDRLIAYSSIRPSKFKLNPISPWGQIFVNERNLGFQGKLYNIVDGRLVVGYSFNQDKEKLYIGFEQANSSKLDIGAPVPEDRLKELEQIIPSVKTSASNNLAGANTVSENTVSGNTDTSGDITASSGTSDNIKQFVSTSLSEVIDAFSNQNLEAESIRGITRQDYGLAPPVAKEGARFDIPSLCSDCGGLVFSFETAESLDSVFSYYNSLPQDSAGYIFVHNNILLQLSNSVTQEVANNYARALQSK